MAITVLGKETLVAVKPETSTAEGTPVACGAGNQIDIISAEIDATMENKVDEDTLSPSLKSTWQEPKQASAKLNLSPKYQTLEPIFAVALGSEIASAQQTNPRAYSQEFREATISRALTLAVAKGEDKAVASILEVIELTGCKVSELTIDQSDMGRAKIEASIVAKDADYDSTTNTGATMDDITFGDASYPVNLMTFDHLKRGGVRLAAQGSDVFGDSQKVAVSAVKVGIKTGLLDSIDDNYSTSGREVPVQAGKFMASLGLTLFRDSTAAKAIYDLIRNNQLLKAILYWKSDRGIPGCIISASSPSVDISGGTDTKLNFTITHILTGTAEDVEITLTLTGLNSGANIAAAIQAALRAKTATSALIQEFLDTAVCNYDSQVAGKYYISANTSVLYDIDSKAASEKDLADELKLSTGASGTAPDHVCYGVKIFMPEVVFSPPSEKFEMGAKPVELEGFAMAGYTTTPYGFNTAEDSLLASNMSGEQIRIVVVNRLTTSPMA